MTHQCSKLRQRYIRIKRVITKPEPADYQSATKPRHHTLYSDNGFTIFKDGGKRRAIERRRRHLSFASIQSYNRPIERSMCRRMSGKSPAVLRKVIQNPKRRKKAV
ncbi:hypothetical protein CAJAP_06204 [Camponotus japonicus]